MAGRASLAGSSSNLFKRSIPKSVHEKKQNVPAAVAGASLHMPSSFPAGDCETAVKTHITSVMMDSIVWRFTMFGSRQGFMVHECNRFEASNIICFIQIALHRDAYRLEL